MKSGEGLHGNKRRSAGNDPERIAQRAAKPGERNLHYIPVGELDARAEAEAVRAKVMNMQVAGTAVSFELEVMVLDVGKAVAHPGLAGGDVL